MKTKSNIIFLMIILFCALSACESARTQADENTPTPTQTVQEDALKWIFNDAVLLPKAEPAAFTIYPKSMSALFYIPEEMRYYFLQYNAWNYCNDEIFGGADYIYGEGEYATQDVFAKIHSIDEDFQSYKSESEYVAESVFYLGGHILYENSGTLRLISGDTDSILLAYDDDMRPKNLRVSGDELFYIDVQNAGLWKLGLNAAEAKPRQIITHEILSFEILDGEIYYLDASGVSLYSETGSTHVLKGAGIKSFAINETLLFTDEDGSLYYAPSQTLIAENVIEYSLLGDTVLYTNEEGLFLSDFSEAEQIAGDITSCAVIGGTIYYTTETGIFAYNIHDMQATQLHKAAEGYEWRTHLRIIQLHNNRLFLEVGKRCSGPDNVYSIYAFDLNDNTLTPLITPSIDKLQTYHCGELEYELSYPEGFVIQYDPGSYYSWRTLFTDPVSGLFLTVMYYEKIYDPIDADSLSGKEFYTNSGVKCYYNFSRNTDDEWSAFYSAEESGESFSFSCHTENGFWFQAYGSVDQFDWIIEIIKSLKVY